MSTWSTVRRTLEIVGLFFLWALSCLVVAGIIWLATRASLLVRSHLGPAFPVTTDSLEDITPSFMFCGAFTNGIQSFVLLLMWLLGGMDMSLETLFFRILFGWTFLSAGFVLFGAAVSLLRSLVRGFSEVQASQSQRFPIRKSKTSGSAQDVEAGDDDQVELMEGNKHSCGSDDCAEDDS